MDKATIFCECRMEDNLKASEIGICSLNHWDRDLYLIIDGKTGESILSYLDQFKEKEIIIILNSACEKFCLIDLLKFPPKGKTITFIFIKNLFIGKIQRNEFFQMFTIAGKQYFQMNKSSNSILEESKAMRYAYERIYNRLQLEQL